MKVRVEWTDDMVVKYDSLEEVVADLIQELADGMCWSGVEWWGQIMNSGEWDEMSVEDKAQCLRDEGWDFIEKLTMED